MNKISLINNKTKESNNKIKKNKFKKFLSSSMAVMVLSVGLAAPMTLRGEETEDKNQITYEELIQKRKESTEELRKAGEKNMKEGLEGIKRADEKIKRADEKIKRADEKIKRADAEIERSKKEIEDAKKKIEEEDKKIEEAKIKCANYLTWLSKVKEYCSTNTCTKEQKNKLVEGEKEYNRECSELMASTNK